MSLGSSVPWQDVLEQVTGTRELDASALTEYFQPIITWLKNENEGEIVGWSTKGCPEGSIVASSADKLIGALKFTVAIVISIYLLICI